MANPKWRTSASKRDRRRSHLALKPNHGSACPNCGIKKIPHRVCVSCGHYRGKQVMEPRSSEMAIPDSFDTSEA